MKINLVLNSPLPILTGEHKQQQNNTVMNNKVEIKETDTHFEAKVSETQSIKSPKSRFTKEDVIEMVLKERKRISQSGKFRNKLKSMSNEEIVKSTMFAYARAKKDTYSFYVKSKFSPSGVEQAFSLSVEEGEKLLIETGSRNQYLV